MPSLLAALQFTDPVMMIIGFGALVVLYLLMRPKKEKSSAAVPISFPSGRKRDVEQQMTDLLVELSKMSRQITAQLDTRAAKLELLIKEADQKIALLQSSTKSAAFPAAAPAIIATSEPAVSRPLDIDPTPATLPAVSALAIDPPTPDPRHSDVYSLADAGRSSTEIARQLTRPAGEIELILALRPR